MENILISAYFNHFIKLVFFSLYLRVVHAFVLLRYIRMKSKCTHIHKVVMYFDYNDHTFWRVFQLFGLLLIPFI